MFMRCASSFPGDHEVATISLISQLLLELCYSLRYEASAATRSAKARSHNDLLIRAVIR